MQLALLCRSISQSQTPDLTPLDFFLWGYVKNIVYQVKIKTRGLRSNIVWIFVVPPRVPTLKFIEKIMLRKKL